MKKGFLLFASCILLTGAAMAQDKKAAATPAKVEQAADGSPLNMKFKSDVHDFGVIAEGPNAVHEFSFTNTGKSPLIIQKVNVSCGCTTPSYTSEPVLPGKTGTITASYATQGRPGAFDKKLTVETNQGNKVLTIKGSVDKAPSSSVPENNTMMKIN